LGCVAGAACRLGRSVDAAVASGFFAGAGGATEVEDDGFQITDEKRETLGFGAQSEELLFEVEIEGQRAGQIEREQRGIGGGEILFGAGDGQEIGVQLNSAGSIVGGWRGGVIVDHENFGLEERALLVDADEFEALAAFGDEVEASVGILFDDGDDFGGAADLGEFLLDGANYAEGALLGEAFGDHFFIARFEDVQRQGGAGEEDDIERKQW
jgi:hypothetical protein